MSDQFRNITNRIVQFVAGERPSADKFNKLVSYFRNNIQSLNNIVGDIEGTQDPLGDGSDMSLKWGRHKDAENAVTGAASRYLDIATLGRLIGPASNLNARELTDRTYFIEDEAIPANTTVYHPNYPILISGTVSITGLTETVLDQPGADEFKVSGDGLEVTFGSLVASDTVLSYTTSPAKYSGGSNYQGARFNVIPDPNQATGVDINAGVDGNTYTIDLPDITHLQSSLRSSDTATLSTSETAYTSDGIHSKYTLPKVLVDKYQETPNGTAPADVRLRPIPKYFLYLKCDTTKEVFKEASYYYVDQHTVYAENLDLGDCDLSNDIFRIVTVGTDITTSIDDLRVKFKKHVHDGSYGESRVSIENLAEIYNNQGSTAPYFKSLHSKNPISYYLHRDGYKEGDDLNANNMMRGHLVIGSTSDGNNIKNGATNSTSYSLIFGYSQLSEGKLSSSPRIFRSVTRDLNILSSTDGDIILDSSQKIRIESVKSQNFNAQDNEKVIELKADESTSINMIGVDPSANAGDDYHAIQAKAKRVALEGEMTSVIGDFFEVGNVDFHILNDENANIKRRPEESLVSILGSSKRDVKNIISGSRINKDVSDNSKHDPTDTADVDSAPHYRKSYLNINATLFRRERELFYIGDNSADIPQLYYDSEKLVDSNGNNPIGGYVIKSSYADILIGGYSHLTNDDSDRYQFPGTDFEDGYINIILDLGYDERGYPIYKNHKAGKEFEITILYTKDMLLSVLEGLKGIRFLTTGPFAKTFTFVRDGTPNDENGSLTIKNGYITKYANSNTVGQYEYIGGISLGVQQFLHEFDETNLGGLEYRKILAGTCLKIKGIETYYPIIIDGSGGLSNPQNSQTGINTAYTCEVILDGTDGTMETLFGTD